MDYEVLIDKYLRGELTEEEKKEFDTLIANKEGFAKNVALMRDLLGVTEASHDEEFKKLMTEFEKEIPPEKDDLDRNDSDEKPESGSVTD